jgi:hypothetical protein
MHFVDRSQFDLNISVKEKLQFQETQTILLRKLPLEALLSDYGGDNFF